MRFFDDLGRDVAFALRSLGRQPGFTAAAVLTLAIGIGGTTAIFGLLHAVFLRPLPYPDPERLVTVTSIAAGAEDWTSPGTVSTWRREAQSLEHVAAVREATLTLSGTSQAGPRQAGPRQAGPRQAGPRQDGPRQDGRPAEPEPWTPERLTGFRVSPDYFQVIGSAPLYGRFFNSGDPSQVVVISHRLWSRRFGADRFWIGRDLVLDGMPHTLLGVMPAEIDLTVEGVDVWTPLELAPGQESNFGGRYLGVVARLRPGVATAEAQAELASIVAGLGLTASDGSPRDVKISAVGEVLTREHRMRFWTLFGAVASVFLIGCANVANLLLARGASRRQELGIRAALGADHGRLLRQLLRESLVLALLGGALGWLLARGVIAALVASIPVDIPRLQQAGFESIWRDPIVFGFALALSGVSCALFGAVPAWKASRTDLAHGLRAGRGVVGGEWLRGGLIVTEVALSMILLVSGGLLIRSSMSLARVEPGFDTERVLTGRLGLPRAEFPELERAIATYQQILAEARAIPGVESAAMITRAPLVGNSAGLDFARVGRPIETGVQSRIRIASDATFRTLGIPVLAGRDFTARDHRRAPRVAVINETLAHQLAPGGTDRIQELIGERLYSEGDSFVADDGPLEWQIVGVVADVRDRGLRSAARPAIFLPMAQAPAAPWEWMERQILLVARAQDRPAVLAPALRAAVARIAPTVPLFDVRTTGERLTGSLAAERFNTAVLSVLGGIGLLLATIGLYGVVSFFVQQRLSEIGIRIALGADRAAIRRLVTRRGLRPVLFGVALGLPGALATTRWLEPQLYGVSPVDLPTLVAVAAALVAVAGIASSEPARRALSVDPAAALRSDGPLTRRLDRQP